MATLHFDEKPVAVGQSVQVLKFDKDCPSSWLIVQVDSKQRQPLKVTIKSSGGGGAPGLPVEFSVARACFICLPASVIFVTAQNLGSVETNVEVRVHSSDLPVRFENVLSVHGVGNAGDQDVTIPPHACFARLDVDDLAVASTSLLKLINSAGSLDAETSVAVEPPKGLPIGASSQLNVNVPTNNAYRVTFFLDV